MREQTKKQFGNITCSLQWLKNYKMNPELLQLGGETKNNDIFVFQTYGFQHLRVNNVQNRSPDGLGKLIQQIQAPNMTDLVLANNGTVDKYTR